MPRYRRGREMSEGAKQAVNYRRRAQDLRVEAATAQNPEAKKTLMQIADSYIHLAEMIERRTNRPISN
jgi:hypothetical protein